MYVSIYLCIYLCIYVCMYVCMYVRMYVCMYIINICMYVCMHVCTYVCVHTYTLIIITIIIIVVKIVCYFGGNQNLGSLSPSLKTNEYRAWGTVEISTTKLRFQLAEPERKSAGVLHRWLRSKQKAIALASGNTWSLPNT